MRMLSSSRLGRDIDNFQCPYRQLVNILSGLPGIDGAGWPWQARVLAAAGAAIDVQLRDRRG
jgi:hypothetical protein